MNKHNIDNNEMRKILKVHSGFAGLESEVAADELEIAADIEFGPGFHDEDLYTMIPDIQEDENISSYNES